jgi:hypothetical protein
MYFCPSKSTKIDGVSLRLGQPPRKRRILGINVKCTRVSVSRVLKTQLLCQNVCVRWRNKGESEFAVPQNEVIYKKKKEMWVLCTYFVVYICEN